MKRAEITYMEQPAIVACDGRCQKAWGISLRPHHHLDEEELDDVYFLGDDELDEAPRNPGTYEGGHGKPPNVEHFPNKWCVRQCERSVMGKPDTPIELPDWSQGHYNMPGRHPQ